MQINLTLLIIAFVLMIIVHTAEFNMHEVTKQQEGTFYTVSCSFLNDSSNRRYTYKVPNALWLSKDNYAIVETNSGYKIVQVKEVHDNPAIDYNANYEYRWIVDVVTLEPYLRIKRAEKAFIEERKANDKWEF